MRMSRRSSLECGSDDPAAGRRERPRWKPPPRCRERATTPRQPLRLRQAADPEAVAQAAQALLAAQHPILHAGQGVLYAEATDELVQLAEFLQAPVMTTLPGKSAFPEHHPLAVGASGPSTTRGVHRFLMRADLVCGVGCSFTKTNFAVPIPPGKRLVHLTNDEDAINKDYPCEVPVLGDATLVLRQLLAALHTQAGAPRAVDTALHEEIRATKAAWLGEWVSQLTATTPPLNPYRVVWYPLQTPSLHPALRMHYSGSHR